MAVDVPREQVGSTNVAPGRLRGAPQRGGPSRVGRAAHNPASGGGNRRRPLRRRQDQLSRRSLGASSAGSPSPRRPQQRETARASVHRRRAARRRMQERDHRRSFVRPSTPLPCRWWPSVQSGRGFTGTSRVRALSSNAMRPHVAGTAVVAIVLASLSPAVTAAAPGPSRSSSSRPPALGRLTASSVPPSTPST